MATLLLVKYPQAAIDVATLQSPLSEVNQAGLTSQGMHDAEAMAKTIATAFEGAARIWSSPASRCVEPANIIARQLGASLRVDERLADRDLASIDTSPTIEEFRQRQERGFLNPSARMAGASESPWMHRARVESWLADVVSQGERDTLHVVVSHGAVIEHIHSALSLKPAAAMEHSFTYCAPSHCHIWSSVELPDGRLIWCCLGANVNLRQSSAELSLGRDALDELAADLAMDARFQELAKRSVVEPAPAVVSAGYIR